MVQVEPLIGEELLKARSFRQNVRNAAQAVWEILVYVLFILCLMVNTYGNRGNDRYRLTKSLDDIFSSPFESVCFLLVLMTKRLDENGKGAI